MGTLQGEIQNKILGDNKFIFFPGFKLDIGSSPAGLVEEFKAIHFVRISICQGEYKVIQSKQIVAIIRGYTIEFPAIIKTKFIFKTINKLLSYFKTNKYLSCKDITSDWYVNTEEEK